MEVGGVWVSVAASGEESGLSEGLAEVVEVKVREKRGLELVCDECGKVLRSRDGLEYHVNVHLGLRAFRCDEEGCSFASFGAIQLRQHVRWRHLGLLPRRPPRDDSLRHCDICPFASRSLRALSIHTRVCTGPRRHPNLPRHCDDCGRTFLKWTALCSHAFACRRDLLRRDLLRRDLLRRQVLDSSVLSAPSHSPDTSLSDSLDPAAAGLPRKLMHCDECGRGFRSATGLCHHVRKRTCVRRAAAAALSAQKRKRPAAETRGPVASTEPPAAKRRPSPVPPTPPAQRPPEPTEQRTLAASFLVFDSRCGASASGPWPGLTAVVPGSLVPLEALRPLPGLPGHFTSHLGPHHLLPHLAWTHQQPPFPV